MTSSLVGSEMCIRDRLRTQATPPRNTRAPSPRCLSPTSPRDPPEHPVSYTHLTLPTICSV
eukprot:5497910-Prorocentrum_lima.AAC.1